MSIIFALVWIARDCEDMYSVGVKGVKKSTVKSVLLATIVMIVRKSFAMSART